MASFETLSWNDPDVCALVDGRGIATVRRQDFEAYRAWLDSRNYSFLALDFSGGISHVVAELGVHLRWVEQFGYELEGRSRNLNALRDGFHFETDSVGFVLVLQNFDVAWNESPMWCKGLLSIASEHSLRQLALGKRFFAVIPVEGQEVAGFAFEPFEEAIPSSFRFRHGVA